jgi:AraC-like DNA-binding protein
MCPKIQLHLSTVDRKPISPILSFNHYLAHIDLFEYAVAVDTDIVFAAEDSVFLMYIMQHDNSCGFCYLNNGSCTLRIPAIRHKMLVITFRYDWMMYKLQHMKPLNLYSAVHQFEGSYFRFPTLNIAGAIFRAFNKLSSATTALKKDDEGYAFVNGCINKYCNRLISKQKTRMFHQGKAAKVKSFIDQNYTKSVADDIPRLAEEFMLSERNLARIAKLAFGVPLHEHVIKLRIHAGLEQLTATNKPIYEIARQTGYNDPHYFSKAFKKYFGVSPKYIQRPGMCMAMAEMQG